MLVHGRAMPCQPSSSVYSDSCGEPISKPRGPSVESDSGHGIALYQMFQLFLYQLVITFHDTFHERIWGLVPGRVVALSCRAAWNLQSFTTIDCFPCSIIETCDIPYDMSNIKWSILDFTTLTLLCRCHVRSLGSFVGKKRQQFAWIRTARSTPWRDGGNVVLGLGSRGLTVVQSPSWNR